LGITRIIKHKGKHRGIKQASSIKEPLCFSAKCKSKSFQNSKEHKCNILLVLQMPCVVFQ